VKTQPNSSAIPETNPVKDATPKDAAAVILLRKAKPHEQSTNSREIAEQIFWVRRSERLSFLGGFYAFPGGQRDETDAATPVANAPDAEACAMIACAARELFEELGVLVARGAETLTKGQRASLLDDLTSSRMTFPELLSHYDLHLDARDFTFTGRWVTPPFSPRRFDTWFFLVECPSHTSLRVNSNRANGRAPQALMRVGNVQKFYVRRLCFTLCTRSLVV
jgi:8-oxo-dGTP pyrophosphatase MutT (NUDIX family)